MKILLFARLRDALGAPSFELPDSSVPSTVGELRDCLQREAPEALAQDLADPNVLCAVNQVIADDSQPVTAVDEVAFFPPVTGG